jgi:hypothetical protein
VSGTGRPLRFLVVVIGAWIALRTWQLWPDRPPVRAVRHVGWRIVKTREPPVVVADAPRTPPMVPSPQPGKRAIMSRGRSTALPDALSAPVAMPMAARMDPARPPAVQIDAMPLAIPITPAATPRRWSASGWAMVRGSGAGGGVATPQLGGAQAGIRVARAITADGRVAIVARIAVALDTRQQEAAIGIEWRSTALPVRLVAERRIGLADQRGGSALGLIGGVSDRPLPAGFRLDGYAQAGAVLRNDLEGYADGAARATRRVVRTGGGTTFAIGLGLWGGAQRDACRLDVGPAATIDLPLGDAPHLRVALEWRQRVAGAARPGSGPALSIGADY